MLSLIGKALTGVVLDREARDALDEAGGLASAIQSSADARMIKAAMAAQGLHLVGSTPLTSPRLADNSNPLPLAVRIARAAMATAPSEMAPPAYSHAPTVAERMAAMASYMPVPLPDEDSAPMPAPTPDINDRLATSTAPMPRMVPAKPRMPKPTAPAMTGPVTPERAALIAQAMKLHSAKQSVLANLSTDQRALLTSIAMKALFPQAAG